MGDAKTRTKILALIAIIILASSLIMIGTAYNFLFRKGAIIIKVTDQNGKPLKDAVVQLSVIAPPDMPNSSIEVLREQTNKKGVVTLTYKGIFKEIVDRWHKDLEARSNKQEFPKAFKIAVLISVIYGSEKGLYLHDGSTVIFSPALIKSKQTYYKTITIDLNKEPIITKEEIETTINHYSNETKTKINVKIENIELKGLLPHVYWRKVEEKVYPSSGFDKIPIIWSDARNHPTIRGVLNLCFKSEHKVAFGVNLGFLYAKKLKQYGTSAGFTFKIGDFVLASEAKRFWGTVGINPGMFSYIYIMGQIAYEAWELYCYWFSLDEWKFRLFFKDMQVNNENEVVGKGVQSTTPPTLLAKLYEYEEKAGYHTEQYNNIYVGKGTPATNPENMYKIESWDIKEAWISITDVPVEVPVPIGTAFASLKAPYTPSSLPLTILAGIGCSLYIEADIDVTAWVQFDAASGDLIKCLVYVTDFQYEHGSYTYHLPAFGFKWIKPSRGGACPILYVFNGEEYVSEGLLDIHNPEGTDVIVNHTLIVPPAVVNGTYLLRLVEHEKHSYIDQVKLYVVLKNGSNIELPLIYANHSEYGNVLPQLLFSDDWRVDTLINNEKSQYIDLKFAAVLNVKVTKFVFVIEGYNPKIS